MRSRVRVRGRGHRRSRDHARLAQSLGLGGDGSGTHAPGHDTDTDRNRGCTGCVGAGLSRADRAIDRRLNGCGHAGSHRGPLLLADRYPSGEPHRHPEATGSGARVPVTPRSFAGGPLARHRMGDDARVPVDGQGNAINLNQSATQAATSGNCTLVVPPHPLTATGLATP